MTEFEVERSEDRRSYAIAGIGTIAGGEAFSREATAHADDGRTWTLTRTGLLGGGREARDADGELAGSFESGDEHRHEGTISWGGHRYALTRPDGERRRYELREGGRELATIAAGHGRDEVRLTLAGGERLDAGALLYVLWIVLGFLGAAGAMPK